MPRLRRADCSQPGYSRRRAGRGWVYLDFDGERIDDEAVVARISALAIPPAWRDVWICPFDNGHLQAVGTDAVGRRQYLYHDAWRARRDQEKFDDMVEFARRLPKLRRRVARDIGDCSQVSRTCVLGVAVRLLDRGFFRIGSEEYAVTNESYGLATMHKSHVTVGEGGEMVFDYRAKSGLRRVQGVVDPQAAEVVARLKKRRGGCPELLAYKEAGRWRDLKSADINAYVKEATGGDFSAKDFRTWNATVLAAVALAVSGEVAGTKTGRERAIRRAVVEVSHYLGNTPAVCRASYIDPRVFDAYRAGLVIKPVLEGLPEPAFEGQLTIHHREVEEAVIDLIAGDPAPSLAKVA